MKFETLDLDGPVCFADFGGSGPPMVLVHGFKLSHVSWQYVARLLSTHYHVYAIDLPGFGMTPLAGRPATLKAYAEVVGRFIEKVIGGPAILVGHSMGGLISVMTAAARPELVSRLVLANAAFPKPPHVKANAAISLLTFLYLTPILGELVLYLLARFRGPEPDVRYNFKFCDIPVETLPPGVFEDHMEIERRRANIPGIWKTVISATQSIIGVNIKREAFEQTIREVRAPTLIFHGITDRPVPIAHAEHIAGIRKDWTLLPFEGASHMPQVQIPERWVAEVHGWLAAQAPLQSLTATA